MEDIFKSINRITRTKEWTESYNEPIYDSISQVATERINEVSHGKYSKWRTPSKAYKSPHFSPHNSSHFRSPCNINSHQLNRNHRSPQYNHNQNIPKCYYCKGEHHIRDLDMFKWDKVQYKLKTAEIIQNYKEKIIQKAKKDHISINKATFSSNWKSTYSMDQAKQLLGSMQFSDSESESEWLDRYIQEVTIDKVSLENAILYRVKVNSLG